MCEPEQPFLHALLGRGPSHTLRQDAILPFSIPANRRILRIDQTQLLIESLLGLLYIRRRSHLDQTIALRSQAVQLSALRHSALFRHKEFFRRFANLPTHTGDPLLRGRPSCSIKQIIVQQHPFFLRPQTRLMIDNRVQSADLALCIPHLFLKTTIVPDVVAHILDVQFMTDVADKL